MLALKCGIISSYVDSTGSSLGCYEVEKRINSSSKFLDLDGKMLLSVLLKLLLLLVCYLNTVVDPSIEHT